MAFHIDLDEVDRSTDLRTDKVVALLDLDLEITFLRNSPNAEIIRLGCLE